MSMEGNYKGIKCATECCPCDGCCSCPCQGTYTSKDAGLSIPEQIETAIMKEKLQEKRVKAAIDVYKETFGGSDSSKKEDPDVAKAKEAGAEAAKKDGAEAAKKEEAKEEKKDGKKEGKEEKKEEGKDETKKE